MGSAEAERPQSDAPQTLPEGPVEPERHANCLVGPMSHKQCHCVAAYAARDE